MKREEVKGGGKNLFSFNQEKSFSLLLNKLNLQTLQLVQQDTGGDGRTDNTGNVGPHGVHEEEVLGIIFKTDLIDDTGSHRNG